MLTFGYVARYAEFQLISRVYPRIFVTCEFYIDMMQHLSCLGNNVMSFFKTLLVIWQF